jgi:hypothetical protein
MSMSNATENQTLKMHLQGTDPSYRAGATQYLALVTDGGGAVSEAAPIANECTYTGYSRVALTKASAWTDNGSNFTNAALIQFGKRTDGGATQTATAAVVVDTASGAISQGIIATIGAPLAINLNIQPQFAAGDVTITAE